MDWLGRYFGEPELIEHSGQFVFATAAVLVAVEAVGLHHFRPLVIYVSALYTVVNALGYPTLVTFLRRKRHISRAICPSCERPLEPKGWVCS